MSIFPRLKRGRAARAVDSGELWRRAWSADYPGLRVEGVPRDGLPEGRVREIDWRAWLGLPEVGPLSLEVLVKDVPNVDLMWGQGTGTGYWEGAIPGKSGGSWHPVRSFGEAAALVRQDSERRGLGAGNQPYDRGFIRVRKTARILARAAYAVILPDPVISHAPEGYDWHRPRIVLGT